MLVGGATREPRYPGEGSRQAKNIGARANPRPYQQKTDGMPLPFISRQVLHTCASLFKAQFDTELQKLRIQRLRSSKTAEEAIEAFEKKRTQDMKVSVALSKYTT